MLCGVEGPKILLAIDAAALWGSALAAEGLPLISFSVLCVGSQGSVIIAESMVGILGTGGTSPV